MDNKPFKDSKIKLIFYSISFILVALICIAIIPFDDSKDKEKQRFVFAKIQKRTEGLREYISKSLLENTWDSKSVNVSKYNIGSISYINILPHGGIVILASEINMVVIFIPTLIENKVVWACKGNYSETFPRWCNKSRGGYSSTTVSEEG